MSKPDINELISRASFFMQNPEAFNKFISENPNMTEDQKQKLKSLFQMMLGGSMPQDPLSQVNDLLASFKSKIPPELSSVDSIMEQMTKKKP
ncbi:MAG: hypothetical protein HPY50_16515 [Firmicutes bacterium]|nr:hypothetical protein [Bacillota bacterium]